MPPDDLELLAPIKVFLQGPPSRGVERVADAILAARPGMLLICIRG